MFKCMSWTVYRHITPSGKSYIGITSQKPEMRWRNGNGYKYTLFGRAIEKYKWENIQHIIVSTDLTEKEAKWLENYLICYYRTYVGFKDDCKGYNLTLGGEGNVGFVPSKETRIKSSESHKGQIPWNKGKKCKHHSEETKLKMRESHKGKTSGMKGKTPWNKGKKCKHLSDETRRKQSEANKGRIPWNKGIPACNKGKPMSEDAKRKNSESHKGKHRVYHEDGTFHMER